MDPVGHVESMASAAIRHLGAARALIGGWPDDAVYIAGYAPECARKALLTDGRYHKAIGHQVADAHLLAWALDLDGRAGDVAPATVLGAWNPELRYRRTGVTSTFDAASFVDACERDATRLLARAWARGSWLGHDEVVR